jgi:two-component system phosphate regulon sensor histidine kinase PhoR
VFSKDGVRIPLETDVPGLDTALVRSPYRVRLFRHDLVDSGTDLHVLLSDEHASPWYGIGLQLSIAALFIALIVAVFVAALRIIVRQKRISDIRNDLVNNLTHELKTPISTIGLACEAIVDPSIPRTEEQVRSYVGMIRDENKRLGALVENVLQSAVLDSGHMMLKVVELDMHALIHDVIRSSTILVSRRSGRIVTELAAEIHHVQGDRIHLTNLLYNLIDNAVKYTRSEPEIRISTRSNATHLTISVTDNGIGIAPSEQRKIFDRLYRVPTGNIHNAKGFGLGLSYVRTVVERHHGRITLNSTPGQGSTFHIQLPFEHVVTREAASR